MAWPEDRLTTYAPGAQIKSADLNAFQDAIIGGKHGVETRKAPGYVFLNSGSAVYLYGAAAIGDFVGYLPLEVHLGEVLTEVKLFLKDTAGAFIEWQVTRTDMSNANVNGKSDIMNSASSGADQAQVATNLVLEACAANHRYALDINTNNVAHRIYGVEYKVKRP